MDFIGNLVDQANNLVWNSGIPIGGENIPFVVIMLIGVGAFLTVRLSFIQLRRFGHGVAVATGRYDDPNDPGDVSHFQALTTALSATVGIGNIAGVAIAIHWGGPGALFWMWVTALLGMATKYTEVTLAQHYRNVEDADSRVGVGTVSGGPMYYIERGLGPRWKWMAMFFAVMLGITAFLTGNGVQANTVADTMAVEFADNGLRLWMTGLITASLVAAVILGGIGRIGKVTSILAPLMAAVYAVGALLIILLNLGEVMPALTLIFAEAFNPSAGVAGTGVGAVLMTMMWGVRRGLFSNEAGQGSAPIAHAAAKTDEPVSEGVVAILEPFIDTIVICTMTALVIIITGVWSERVPTELTLSGGDLSYVSQDAAGTYSETGAPDEIAILNGRPMATGAGAARFAWHEVAVAEFYLDEAHLRPFTGTIFPGRGEAVEATGVTHTSLYGPAVESGAPLTMLGFRRGLAPLGDWGHYIVILSVFLFGISTAISWSYYGDRCANYLFGHNAIFPYKVVYVLMHFVGAVVSLDLIWTLGDVFLGIVILPNLIALVFLSGKVRELTNSYFQREPWIRNRATD